MPLEFVKSQQGKPNLKHEGNLYCLLRENDELKAWGCDKNSVKPLQQCLRTTFPKYKRLARSIRRQRGWGNNPTTLKDVAIPLEQQLTLRGDIFLASGFDDRERFLIFSKEQNLDLLESNPQWHAAGTFKCRPVLFYQVYTVHGVLVAHTKPLVYMLLKGKTKEI